MGWLEGTRFIYDSLDAEGEPVFPNREAGTVEGLTLTLIDGTSLELSRIEASETVAPLTPAPRVRNEKRLSVALRSKGLCAARSWSSPAHPAA